MFSALAAAEAENNVAKGTATHHSVPCLFLCKVISSCYSLRYRHPLHPGRSVSKTGGWIPDTDVYGMYSAHFP